MGNAKKCDRCGKLYEMSRKMQEYRLIRYRENNYTKSLDLCAECSEKLKKWFEQPMFAGKMD